VEGDVEEAGSASKENLPQVPLCQDPKKQERIRLESRANDLEMVGLTVEDFEGFQDVEFDELVAMEPVDYEAYLDKRDSILKIREKCSLRLQRENATKFNSRYDAYEMFWERWVGDLTGTSPPDEELNMEAEPEPLEEDEAEPVAEEEAEPVAEEEPKPQPEFRILRKLDRAEPEKLVSDLVQGVLALPDPDALPAIPTSKLEEVLRRPKDKGRPEREAVTLFRMRRAPAPPAEDAENAEDAAPADAENAEEQETWDSEGRWIIGPKEEIELQVVFRSPETGNFSSRLAFEVVGNTKQWKLDLAGTCAIPAMSSDPRVVFNRRVKARAKGKIIKRKWVLSDKVFEFGPLIIGRAPEGPDDEKSPVLKKTNSEAFKIVNTGLFDLNVNFAFEKEGMGEFTPLRDDAKAVDGQKVFHVEPETLTLAPETTGEVVVWAFPNAVGTFSDTLCCTLEHNPEVVKFPVACGGSSPEVAISANELSFDRLLCSSSPEAQVFTIENKSSVSAKWKLSGLDADDFSKELTFDPTEGVIKPLKSQEVRVVFAPKDEEKEFDHTVTLQVSDAAELLGTVQEESVQITGETFKILASVDIPEEALDFGVVRVSQGGEEHSETRELTIANNGKYSIKYKFEIRGRDTSKRKQLIEKFFTIEPSEGTLEPSDNTTVTVKFQADEEVSLPTCSNLRLNVIEGREDTTVHDRIPVKMCARTALSKFRCIPASGINFGPIEVGKDREKTIKIINDGDFDFEYTIRHVPKEAPEGADDPEPVEELKFDDFTINPAKGVCPKGQEIEVKVHLAANKLTSYLETISLDVRDRTPNQPRIRIELAGDGCSQGIETQDFRSIFEEQACQLVPPGNATAVDKNMFVIEDRAFLFKPINVKDDGSAFWEERFKISNPFNIPCSVKMSVTPRLGPEPCPFTIEPSELQLPAHESFYMKCKFAPTTINMYTALFKAVVEQAIDDKGKELTFELRGSGTLPRLRVIAPVERTSMSEPLIAFNRLFVGRSAEKTITILNDGIVPVSFRFKVPTGKGMFSFSGHGQHVLSPLGRESFKIQYTPTEPGAHEYPLGISVQSNPFEATKFKITGEGYCEDMTLEGDLAFGDVPVGISRRQEIQVQNHSKHHVYKYTVTCDEDAITVKPSEGHVGPMDHRALLVTFQSNEAQDFEGKVKVHVEKIRYTNAEDRDDAVSWDNTPTQVEFVSLEAYKEEFGELPENHPADQAEIQVKRAQPEPAFERVDPEDSEPKVLEVDATAHSDQGEVECSVQTIPFRQTMMYQTRSYTFTVSNTSALALKYDWTNALTEPDPTVFASPFELLPTQGSIPSQQEETFTVKFAPIDARRYAATLTCAMEGLKDDSQAPVVKVTGKAMRPMVHFDLTPSDWLHRRESDLKGQTEPVDPATRVVEMTSLGTSVRNTVRIEVVNPTNISYDYVWQSVQVPKCFRCLTTTGTIYSGQKAEMVFEYAPDEVDLIEGHWIFTLPAHKIQIPFITVGSVVEPNVQLDRNHLEFTPQLVNKGRANATVFLENTEHLPFSFRLSSESRRAIANMNIGTKSALEIQPLNGVVGPNTRCPINISFTPLVEISYNFNLAFTIRKKQGPAFLNIKGEGYVVRSNLLLQEESGLPTELKRGTVNKINFGTVYIKENMERKLIIENTSRKFKFDFKWKMGTNDVFSITPETGTIQKGEQMECLLQFCSPRETFVEGCRLNLEFSGATQYQLMVSGRAKKPRISFSTREIRFGSNFLYHPNSQPPKRSLRVTNQEPEDSVALDILFQQTQYLEILNNTGSITLAPNEHADIEFVFKPRGLQNYKEIIPFEVNGLYTTNVTVFGSCCSREVALADPSQRNIAFGQLRVGQTRSRNIAIVNDSSKSAMIRVVPNERLKSKYVTIRPTNFKLRAGERKALQLTFSPIVRLPPFSSDVDLHVEGVPQRLLEASGACHGIGARLDTDTLQFGGVVKGSTKQIALKLGNIGDIGAKFVWDTKRLQPHFTITPTSGFIEAHESTTLNVTFAPTKLDHNIKVERVPCKIEGSPDPQYLTLTGACVAQPTDDAQELSYESKVRQRVTQNITLENSSSDDWVLTPVIQHAFWSGNPTIRVPKNSKAEYALTYCPLVMTASDSDASRKDKPKKHIGSVFFPLPNGSAIIYNLSGTADAPEAEQVVEESSPCKVNKAVVLRVKNWLNDTQRFRVEIKKDEEDDTIFIRGAEWVDVPGRNERKYIIRVTALKEGESGATIKFVSQTDGEYSGEYQFFKLKFTATEPQVIQTLALNSNARARLAYQIPVNNPLDREATIDSFESDEPTLTIPSLPVTISPSMEGRVNLIYRPLTVTKNKEATLRLKSNALGDFLYKLDLTCKQAGVERTLRFNARLGDGDMQTFRFKSFCPSNATYKCDIDGTEFKCKDSVAVAGASTEDGVEASVDVEYTPSGIGEIRNLLTVKSADGGEYQCALFGVCKPPKPQGPFPVKAGGSVSVPFKNSFSAACQFEYSVDSPDYQLPKATDSLSSGASTNIAVSFKPTSESKRPIMGKLLVSCPMPPNGVPVPPWVFYLKGEM